MGCYPAHKPKHLVELESGSVIGIARFRLSDDYYPAMFLITSNKSKSLLSVSFIGTVQPEDFQSSRADVTTQLAGLSPGFHYLVDFTHLELMGLECMTELGRLMDLLKQAGVGLVVRIIPDPSKDIGMNILTIFHYPPELKVVTCENLAEAVKALGL